jgi:hypothetical protein
MPGLFSKKLGALLRRRRHGPEDESLDPTDRPVVSTARYLKRYGILPESLRVREIDNEKVISSDEFLQQNQIGIEIRNIDEAVRVNRERHRVRSRTTILNILAIQMLIIPIWLMVLLTFPNMGKVNRSETIQVAILTAIAGDFAGLYYIVTRHLFPQNEVDLKENTSSEEETSEDEDDI